MSIEDAYKEESQKIAARGEPVDPITTAKYEKEMAEDSKKWLNNNNRKGEICT